MLKIDKDMEDKYYTIKEVAEIFKVAYLTVYRWIVQGKLEAYKIGKKYMIKEEDIQKLLDNSKVKKNVTN
ncbi:MAG: Helix-turn-helix domain protein [candidate division WS6 bacterium OLB21]|uniref:Helix-turn-helix domain protein n=1 Tax=candidate division WS6 bacterium OLB21 TaxID=1617427 RepID=A0A136KJ22_9BACT|nr:MAG: Helix-turn-helix domain protein [candidate division WS6 bacterium OLB21]